MKARRKFACGQGPEPGQLWKWLGGREPTFYFVKRARAARQGEMWVAINVDALNVEEVFFSSVDVCSAWTRIA